jgi:hypothetical protein
MRWALEGIATAIAYLISCTLCISKGALEKSLTILTKSDPYSASLSLLLPTNRGLKKPFRTSTKTKTDKCIE